LCSLRAEPLRVSVLALQPGAREVAVESSSNSEAAEEMTAKRRALWQILAAQLLLVAMPIYGLAPELSALASARADWEPKTHLRASSLAREKQPQALLLVSWEIASGDSFHAEGIGSIRALTDELGNVTDRYTLEAFGDLLVHQGDGPNVYLFAGESREPNVDLYYLRARWLGTSTQAFISLDPVLQLAERRDGVLPYVFASSDPVNRGDPSGLSPTLRGPTPWAAARVGSYVHHRIGIDFRGKGPNRYANYTPIWQILGLAGPGECRTSALFCRLKPDLVDGDSGEAYV